MSPGRRYKYGAAITPRYVSACASVNTRILGHRFPLFMDCPGPFPCSWTIQREERSSSCKLIVHLCAYYTSCHLGLRLLNFRLKSSTPSHCSVVAICLILSIPTCCTLEQQPGQCSDEPKCAVLDYDDLSTYSITRGVCRDGATCKCLPGDPHSITKAYIYDRSGREYNLSVSNDQHHFNVSINIIIAVKVEFSL